MKKTLLISLSNYPESCNLCRFGLIKDYTDSYKLRKTDNFAVHMIKSGSLIVDSNNTEIRLKKGDIYFTYPGIVSKVVFQDPGTQIYTIDYSKEFLNYDPKGETIKDRFIRFLMIDEAIGKGRFQLLKVSLPGEDQVFVAKQIERFGYEFSLRREGMFDILQSILISIIGICGWRFLYQPNISFMEKKYHRANDILLKSVGYIHEHFCEKITVNDIVERFATSRTTYCTMFKQMYGVTFYEYLMELRREKAIQLLLDTDISMDEVAYNSGFCDNSSLYRYFMKYFGISPGKYRKLHRV